MIPEKKMQVKIISLMRVQEINDNNSLLPLPIPSSSPSPSTPQKKA